MDTAYIRRPTARRLSEESICADSIGSRDLGEGKTSTDPQGSFADEQKNFRTTIRLEILCQRATATMKQNDRKPYPESGIATMPFQSSLNP